MTRTSQIIATIALLLSTLAFAQEPPVTNAPAFTGIKLPFDEKWMLPYPDYPTTRVWRYRTAGILDAHTTAQSVGPDSAVLFFHPRGTKNGEVLIYDVSAREADKDITNYKGLCFWMKADGGDGQLSMGAEWNQELPAYPRVGKFPLATKEWKKFFIPWDKFEKPAKPGGFYFLNVKLEPATDRDAWALLSRVALYKDEKTETIAPPADVDPPGMIPAEKFIEPALADSQKMLRGTLTKLRAKKPLTIVVTGDSITAGAQIYNTAENAADTYAHIFWARLEAKLAAHYAYDKHRFVFKKWIFPDNKTEPEHFEFVTGQSPAADGTLPFDGLQIIGVGAGGKDAQFGEQHLADLTQFKPDLVIWTYGANDATANRGQQYTDFTTRAIQQLQKQNIEVILACPTPWANLPYYNHSEKFQDHARAIAKAANVPFVNQFANFTSRGHRYVGDLLADQIHPNEHGHEQMSAPLAALLGVPNEKTWNRPWFQQKFRD